MDLQPHIKYALYLLDRMSPSGATSMDSMRVTVLYFALFTLDICGALGGGCSTTPSVLHPTRSREIVAWVYTCLQGVDGGAWGFCGGPHTPLHPTHAQPQWHLACTYAALCSLVMLGDDLSRVPRQGLQAALEAMQGEEGGFASSPACPGEVDLRYVFSATACATLLGLPFPRPQATRAFIARCQTQEGGFSLAPGAGEAHGASTYCALAALQLLGGGGGGGGGGKNSGGGGTDSHSCDNLDTLALARWLSLRIGGGEGTTTATVPCEGVGVVAEEALLEAGGLTGRAGKGGDVCYTWWVGAAAMILEEELGGGEGCGGVARAPLGPLLKWLEGCRGAGGAGFGKDTEADADPFHTTYALAGWAIAHDRLREGRTGSSGCSPILPALGLTRRAARTLGRW